MRIFTFIIFLAANAASGQYIHSHNDYKQAKPFYEAFENNSYSIEADVFLQDGKLFVAHEAHEIDQNKTLSELYLVPLSKITDTSKVQLLVDIKTEAYTTIKALMIELEAYPTLIKNNRIRFVISGNRPASNEYHLYPDYIFFDQQSLENIQDLNPNKIALFSFPFQKYSKWSGLGDIAEKDSQEILKISHLVHDLGYEIRFWGTPDTPIAWRTFQRLGIDYINTDLPAACNKFLYLYK